mmetsp:Transcript_14567/g.45165  ORF Transcript_14567/g.45165 Transcript_14567/m.45165 type:complete len:678 (-) Transcript_14567:159-2192(-)|eukprot:CAMPEP_0174832530 /NCGR_PEP_ID=MMETSP1114-20130205/3720_1 /TAXON_ID=312471 /ORGANISM="Neobodo designis, Strain CCAP 1951/1" /LENGTH=677 /DNA_ID=CAMNT_0016066389 /DNA_START=76 /DNA_END=2109 /DNA_ORIENTATION=-
MNTSANTSLNRSGKRAPSTDALRSFYFSSATNYSAFKSKAQSPSAHDASAVSQVTAAAPASPAPEQPSPTAPKQSVAAGSAVKAVKSSAPNSRPASRAAAGTADAVSPEYITFLRQQQDLVKSHAAINESLKAMLAVANGHKTDHETANDGALELLRDAESSTDWHWKSKFTLDALIRDAELEVPLTDLCAADALPRIADLQNQHQQLVKLKQDHPDAAAFTLLLDNGVRRMERLMKEFEDSQLDAERVTRLSDTLMVQLDHVMSVKPLAKVLQDIDDQIAVISAKRKQCAGMRDQALEDGAMDVAERESYRLADISEELLAAQLERIRILTSVSRDHAITSEVREEYANKAAQETAALTDDNVGLRQRCEEDLARLYKLRRLADETEDQQADRWKADRAASDAKLASIAQRQQEAWAGIQMLVKQLMSLEDERHHECKRRIEEKVKDEGRRNEYTVFRNVADTHAATLDRTIKNCDINVHCAKLMHEFVTTGFNTIQKHITACKAESDTELLGAQKTHLDLYRGLLFTLGDLDYKKGKRIDEVSENIQAAHIQQELCSDSLNPNAKKFSDAKRELLRIRDELELELADLKDRQRVATEQFDPTERALVAAGVEHVHPTEELEDWRLETRAKMVEYKAMSLGHSSSAPLKSEIDALRKTFNESRARIKPRESSSMSS